MAGDKAVSTVSKPQMRGLLNSSIKRNLIISLPLAALTGNIFKQLVGTEPRGSTLSSTQTTMLKKEFEDMKKKGNSC